MINKWRGFYKETQCLNFDLINKKINNLNIIPYNTNNTYENNIYNINYLNWCLGELPMMYYIWKNNIKSDIIDISQYRRQFINIDYNKIYDNQIEVYDYSISADDHIINTSFLTPEIIIKYKQYIKDKYNIKNNNIYSCKYPSFCKIMFICKWEIFCDMCDFIFGFLDYLFPNEQWKDYNNIISFIRNCNYKSLENMEHYNLYYYWYQQEPRTLPIIFELLIPHYLFIKQYKIYQTKRNLSLTTIINNENDLKYINKFITYNIGNISPTKINILDPNNYITDNLAIWPYDPWGFNFDSTNINIINNDNYTDDINDIFLDVNSFIKFAGYNVDYTKDTNMYISKIQ